ncbi:MAG: hypothetical protein ABJF65_04820, partial [Reichenbachiella sp.]
DLAIGEEYQLQYSTAGLSTVTRNGITSTPVLIENLQANATYSWRVIPKCNGAWSQWPSTWAGSFTTAEAPSCFITGHTSAPFVNETHGTASANLSWDDLAIGEEYQLQYSTVGLTTVTLNAITSTPVLIENLQANATYSWRVVPKCNGAWSQWPSAWAGSFTTPDAASCIVSGHTATPFVDQATGTVSANLNWDDLSIGGEFQVQYSTPGQSALIVNGVTSPPVLIENLQPNATYSWRVLPKCNEMWSQWPSAWAGSFTTPEEASCVAGGHTANVFIDASTNSVMADVSWDEVPEAQSYLVNYWHPGNDLSISLLSQTTTSARLVNLVPDATYSWRVRVNCTGTWEDLPAWQSTFDTPAGATSCEMTGYTANAFADPDNGGDISVDFSWDALAMAESYRIQYNTAEGTVTLDASPEFTVQVQKLPTNELIRWKGIVKCNGQWSQWPNDYQDSFTTPEAGPANLVPDDQEFLALKEFFESTGGDKWADNKGWPYSRWPDAKEVTSEDFATWEGVHVTDGDVDMLGFKENNLIGTIPKSVSNLTQLTHFSVPINQLTGELPAELARLPRLRNVDIRENGFTGIPNLSKLLGESLSVNVSENQLQFGDLEPLLEGKYFYLAYDNQNTVLGKVETHAMEEGIQYEIDLSKEITGTENAFQWQKWDAGAKAFVDLSDNDPKGELTGYEGTKSATLTIEAQNGHTGDYRLKVTNSLFKEMEMYSYIQTVEVEVANGNLPTSAIEFPHEFGWNVDQSTYSMDDFTFDGPSTCDPANNGGRAYKNMWFKFVATDPLIELTFDAALEANTVSIDLLENLETTLVSCEIITTGNSSFDYGELEIGKTYYVAVNIDYQNSGTFGFTVKNTPNGNTPETAIEISHQDGWSVDKYTYTPETFNFDDRATCSPLIDGGPARKNMWFKFTATDPNIILTFDPSLEDPWMNIDLFQELSTPLVSCKSILSTASPFVYSELEVGKTYFVAVNMWYGSSGSFGLKVKTNPNGNFWEEALEIPFVNGWTSELYDMQDVTTTFPTKTSCDLYGANRWHKFTPTASNIKITANVNNADMALTLWSFDEAIWTELSDQRSWPELVEGEHWSEINCLKNAQNPGEIVLSNSELIAGQTYYISMRTNESGVNGTYDISIETFDSNHPEGALEIPYIDGWTSLEDEYHMANLTGVEPSSSCRAGVNRWHKFTAGGSYAKVSANIFRQGSLTLYSYDGNTFTQMQCVSSGNSEGTVVVTSGELIDGQDYYVSVTSNAATGANVYDLKMEIDITVDSNHPEGALEIPYIDGWTSLEDEYHMASLTGIEPASSCRAGVNRWHKFTAGGSYAKVSANIFRQGSLTLYSYDGNTFTQMQCVSSGNSEGTVVVTSGELIDGQDYYVSVTSNTATGGNLYDLFIETARKYSVVWKSPVNIDIESDNHLIKSTTTAAWDAGATSYNILAGNEDGYIEFAVGEAGNVYMIGLSSQERNVNFNTINHAIYLDAAGIARIYENGGQRLVHGLTNPGDIFRIGRVGDQVKYYKNGEEIYST